MGAHFVDNEIFFVGKDQQQATTFDLESFHFVGLQFALVGNGDELILWHDLAYPLRGLATVEQRPQGVGTIGKRIH
ncbi:MAG: hypothetical protein QNJ78_13755, partial [Gammaproteobacteria bacterium]|nr:hypothetical protein [Gammaproteobacteria bacterium]